MDLMDLANLIEEHRTALGLSMAQVHERAFPQQKNATAIPNIKRGIPPTFTTLNKLCDALGLELYIGPPITKDARVPPPLTDNNRLLMAITLVETAMSRSGKKMKPAKKAEIILAAYDLLADVSAGAENKIIRLVKAA